MSVEEIVNRSPIDMTFWERLQSNDWRLEIGALIFITGYVVLYQIGASYNKKLAYSFIDAVVPNLKENFYQVGVAPNQLVAKDNEQSYTLYATGRTKLDSVTAKIQLQPRQNLFMWIMESILSFFIESVATPEDVATVTFEFDQETSDSFDNFIWAIVTKDKMDRYRNENYFLSLTKTSEASKLSNQFVFMNEVPEMNDILYTKKLGDFIKANSSLIKYFAITDQQAIKPEKIAELRPKTTFVLSFKLTSQHEQVENIKNFFNYILNDYVDLVSNRATFRPELLRKVKKTRETEYSKVKKVLDDAKREELANKKLEEEKALRAAMTPQQQQKLAKRQQERKQRKQLNRQKVRGSM